MKSQGITQVALAGRIGVTQAAVSKWMNGTVPMGDQLLFLAKALGVNMEWLLTGNEPKYPNFIIWKDGFILAHWGGSDASESGENTRIVEPATSAISRFGFTRFRFLPADDPNAIPREEQVRFYQSYVAASVPEKRKMLSLGPGTEWIFTLRLLNAIGFAMKRQLEG